MVRPSPVYTCGIPHHMSGGRWWVDAARLVPWTAGRVTHTKDMAKSSTHDPLRRNNLAARRLLC